MAESETPAQIPALAPALAARRLMRSARTATLASALPPQGWPYGSLVLVAADQDASPILLISRLAEHTRNILADARVSLLYDGTAGLAEPLTGPRVTVLGRAAATQDERVRARFLARHPGAAMYAGFADFAFYRVAVERGHLVAGFGRIDWIAGTDLLYAGATAPLAEAEASVLAHMNADHADAVQLYAGKLLGREGEGWRMVGCDAEGCDLARGPELARLPFDKPAADAEAVRAELVRLVKRARA